MDESTVEDDRQPFDRLDRESNSQWLAFRCYRDLGPIRTRREAYEEYKKIKGLSGKQPHPDWKVWFFDNDWQERAAAFDRWADKQHRKLVVQRRQEAFEAIANHAPRVARRLIAGGLGALDGTDDEGDPQQFTSDQRMALQDVLDRAGVFAPDTLELNANVTTDQTVNQTTTSIDAAALAQFDDDTLEDLEAVLAKLAKPQP